MGTPRSAAFFTTVWTRSERAIQSRIVPRGLTAGSTWLGTDLLPGSLGAVGEVATNIGASAPAGRRRP
jgi:hypothetical protein